MGDHGNSGLSALACIPITHSAPINAFSPLPSVNTQPSSPPHAPSGPGRVLRGREAEGVAERGQGRWRKGCWLVPVHFYGFFCLPTGGGAYFFVYFSNACFDQRKLSPYYVRYRPHVTGSGGDGVGRSFPRSLSLFLLKKPNKCLSILSTGVYFFFVLAACTHEEQGYRYEVRDAKRSLHRPLPVHPSSSISTLYCSLLILYEWGDRPVPASILQPFPLIYT